MNKAKQYFIEKTWGFYVSLAGAALLLVTAIIYSATFSVSEHININFNASVLVLMLLGVVAFAALSAFNVTRRYAAPALFLFAFIAFLVFELSSYVYLSAVFFEASTAAEIAMAFKSMEFGYAFCTVAFIVVWALSTIGIFTEVNKSDALVKKQAKLEKKATKEAAHEAN